MEPLDFADGVTLDLFVEEPVLGHDSRFLRGAGVRFGRATVSRVADTELPVPVQRRVDRGSWRFDMLSLPWQLEQLATGRHYVNAHIRMAFDSPDVRSVRLLPVTEPDEPHVALSTSGAGMNELSWHLDAGGDDGPGLRAGGREFQAIVESPLTSAGVTGVLDARVRYARSGKRLTRGWDTEPHQPVRFSLDLKQGAFSFLPGPGAGSTATA
jgi:hypothetical protein